MSTDSVLVAGQLHHEGVKLHVSPDERLRVVHQPLRLRHGLRQAGQVLFGPPLGEQRRARRLDEGPGVVDVLQGGAAVLQHQAGVAGRHVPVRQLHPGAAAGARAGC